MKQMGHDGLNKVLNIKGESSERLIPGIHPIQDYFSHIARYLFSLDFLRLDDIVLDIACGVGYGSNYIADKCKKVIGIDVSKDAVSYAKKNYADNLKGNITFMEGNAEKIPLNSESVDAVVSFETIEHLLNPGTFLAECNRVLKNKGHFIVSTPNKKLSDSNNPHHINELYIKDFLKMIKDSGFKVDNVYAQIRGTTSNQKTVNVLTKLSDMGKYLPSNIKYPLRDFLVTRRETGLDYTSLKAYRENPKKYGKRIKIPKLYMPVLASNVDYAEMHYLNFIVVGTKS